MTLVLLRTLKFRKKYGLRQTIADSLGIGGIMRGLRTIPVMQEFANDIEEVCPDALVFKLYKSNGDFIRLYAEIYWCKNRRSLP